MIIKTILLRLKSEIDDCRFEISVNNLIWYLRAENSEEKSNWVEVLKSFRVSYKKRRLLNENINCDFYLDDDR